MSTLHCIHPSGTLHILINDLINHDGVLSEVKVKLERINNQYNNKIYEYTSISTLCITLISEFFFHLCLAVLLLVTAVVKYFLFIETTCLFLVSFS